MEVQTSQVSFKKKTVLFLAISILTLLTHLPFFSLPPVGTHTFRQVHTLSVARNFANESMNILQPRVDRRYNTNGVTGVNFPLFEWGLAAVWKVTGVKESLHRPYAFAWYLLGIAGAIWFFSLLFTRFWTVAAGSFAYAFSPEIFYHGINALPDTAAMALSACGLAFAFSFFKNNKSTFLYSGLILLVLAGLIKIYFLPLAILPAVFLLRKLFLKQLSIRVFIFTVLIGLLGIAAIAAWYKYAAYLTETTGLYEFGLHLHKVDTLKDAVRILFQNVSIDIPEVLVGYVVFVLGILGLVLFLKQKELYKNTWFWVVLTWSICTAIIHYLLLVQMEHHNYYLIPYIIPMILAALFGIDKISPSKNYLSLFLIVFATVWAPVRIIPSRWVENKYNIPSELYSTETRTEIENLYPSDAFTFAGPDHIGCFLLYYFNKKGAAFSSWEELWWENPKGQNYLEQMIELGATHFLIRKEGYPMEDKEKLKPYLGKKLFSSEQFEVYELKVDKSK